MSAKETLGFLTESALLPRKAKPIAVADDSISLLRSLTERSLAARRGAAAAAATGSRPATGQRSYKRGRSDVDALARRPGGDASLGAGPNAGVADRAAADERARETPAQRLATGRMTLEAKVRAEALKMRAALPSS